MFSWPVKISAERLLVRYKTLSVLFGLAIALNAILWVVLLWRSRFFEATMPLHYTIYFGIDSFGPWYYIFLLPGFGLLVFLVNTALAVAVVNREKMLSYFLAAGSLLVQTINLMAAIALLFILS
jgi:hypothetical protein